MMGRDRLLAEVQPLSDLEVLQRLLPTVLAHARLGGADDAAWALRALAFERGWMQPKGDPRALGARWSRKAQSESLSTQPPGEDSGFPQRSEGHGSK